MWEGRAWECHDLGRTYSVYSIDPSGRLWWIDTENTHDFLIVQEGDPGYDARHTWKNTRLVRSGRKGRVSPCCYTGRLDLLPKLVRNRPDTVTMWMDSGVRVDSN